MTVLKPVKAAKSSPVSVVGIAAEYPPTKQGPEFVDALARRHYEATPA